MREPKCPYYEECGGCSAQHIPYELQIINKQKKVSAMTGIPEEEIELFSANEYNYRNRMDFVFHAGGLGLRRKGRWDRIVDIERCVISEEKINSLLKEIRREFKEADYFDLRKKTGTYRYAVIRKTKKETNISFVLNEDSPKLGEAITKIKEYSEKSSADNITITRTPKDSDKSISENYFMVKGKDEIEEELLSKKFSFNIQGFFQNNHAMTEKMLIYTKELLEKEERKGKHLLDLYGGVGTFGITNSEEYESVTIIENYEGLVKSAEKNAEKNQTKNVKTKLLDASQLRKIKNEIKKPLHIITDPPRSGMHPKTVKALLELEPEIIIYISCNPAQLGKELIRLKEKYLVEKTAVFDLFPQTPHTETIIKLKRKI